VRVPVLTTATALDDDAPLFEARLGAPFPLSVRACVSAYARDDAPCVRAQVTANEESLLLALHLVAPTADAELVKLKASVISCARDCCHDDSIRLVAIGDCSIRRRAPSVRACSSRSPWPSTRRMPSRRCNARACGVCVCLV
jgi:hypothetical protein